MRWEEVVQEALCFGWIDSTVKKVDDERRKQLFTPRNPKSGWSKVNKNYVKKLTANNLMHESGLQKIKIAFKNFQAFSKGYKKIFIPFLINYYPKVLENSGLDAFEKSEAIP